MAKKAQIAKRGAGRPERISEEVIAKICEGLRDGLPRKYAACHGGISPRSYHNWYAQGQEDEDAERDTLYARFKFAVDSAETETLRTCLTSIRRGGRDWKALAWFVEKRFRDEFGAKEAAQPADASGKVVIEVPSYGSDSTAVSAAPEAGATTHER